MTLSSFEWVTPSLSPVPSTSVRSRAPVWGRFYLMSVSNSIGCYIPSTVNGFSTFSVRYADDTQVAITGPRSRLHEMRLALENVLEMLCTWFFKNRKMVNASKTELLMCGDNRQLRNISAEVPQIEFMGQTTSFFKNSLLKTSEASWIRSFTWDLHILTALS